MTEQEKRRLEELLAEDDSEDDNGEDKESRSEASICCGNYEGFKHSKEDEAALRDIDRYGMEILLCKSSIFFLVILSS